MLYIFTTYVEIYRSDEVVFFFYNRGISQMAFKNRMQRTILLYRFAVSLGLLLNYSNNQNLLSLKFY